MWRIMKWNIKWSKVVTTTWTNLSTYVSCRTDITVTNTKLNILRCFNNFKRIRITYIFVTRWTIVRRKDEDMNPKTTNNTFAFTNTHNLYIFLHTRGRNQYSLNRMEKDVLWKKIKNDIKKSLKVVKETQKIQWVRKEIIFYYQSPIPSELVVLTFRTFIYVRVRVQIKNEYSTRNNHLVKGKLLSPWDLRR